MLGGEALELGIAIPEHAEVRLELPKSFRLHLRPLSSSSCTKARFSGLPILIMCIPAATSGTSGLSLGLRGWDDRLVHHNAEVI
jgi:hypothetical protein